MSLGLAALAGAAEAAGRMRRECGSLRACCESRVGSPFEFDCDCTGDFFLEKAKALNTLSSKLGTTNANAVAFPRLRWASGMMKEISIVWTMMSEAPTKMRSVKWPPVPPGFGCILTSILLARVISMVITFYWMFLLFYDSV
ncbi:hypothetical protein AK812_SmicGene11217 [Symbiodinium microadriaticum]|uniref:Uncharacterized protein n=1 Tax=Symbiodinium microadriaticum TaxID=2951 RepID=A0A1Q9EDW9_SYMMI|nr:hypothetical protein AK812_SmicGene11217 [Symbiodinium microadriaticum]